MTNLLDAIGSHDISVALGDTFADIPLLDKAEKAIVVDPDRKLKQKASRSGWYQIGN
jgi:phosphoserine phosphatase